MKQLEHDLADLYLDVTGTAHDALDAAGVSRSSDDPSEPLPSIVGRIKQLVAERDEAQAENKQLRAALRDIVFGTYPSTAIRKGARLLEQIDGAHPADRAGDERDEVTG